MPSVVPNIQTQPIELGDLLYSNDKQRPDPVTFASREIALRTLLQPPYSASGSYSIAAPSVASPNGQDSCTGCATLSVIAAAQSGFVPRRWPSLEILCLRSAPFDGLRVWHVAKSGSFSTETSVPAPTSTKDP